MRISKIIDAILSKPWLDLGIIQLSFSTDILVLAHSALLTSSLDSDTHLPSTVYLQIRQSLGWLKIILITKQKLKANLIHVEMSITNGRHEEKPAAN